MRHTCTFCKSWDPETLEPRGPKCGATAVEAIYWKDGRVSEACSRHGIEALDADARKLVVKVVPIQ